MNSENTLTKRIEDYDYRLTAIGPIGKQLIFAWNKGEPCPIDLNGIFDESKSIDQQY